MNDQQDASLTEDMEIVFPSGKNSSIQEEAWQKLSH